MSIHFRISANKMNFSFLFGRTQTVNGPERRENKLLTSLRSDWGERGRLILMNKEEVHPDFTVYNPKVSHRFIFTLLESERREIGSISW